MGLREIQILKGVPGISPKQNQDPIGHAKQFLQKIKVKANRKKPNLVSLTMAQIKKLLPKIYDRILKKNPVCVINSPVCAKQATCVNHTKGRGKNEIMNVKFMESSCAPCNGWIESHHAWAEENGHKISRHTK